MRPPTRSTRSIRPPSDKRSTNPRGNRSDTSNPPNPATSQPNLSTQPNRSQSQATVAAAAAETNVDSSTSSGGSDLAPMLVLGCFPVLPSPATFVFENQRPEPEAQTAPGSNASALGKPPRSRHRMTSGKLETLDAFFRHNTHPSRKEKEAICKDLDMDLKTVTIWFQNKRQTVARSNRKQLESEGATSSSTGATATAAMDMLASASATMSPLAATVVEKPSSEYPASTVQLDSGTERPRADLDGSSLDPSASQLLLASPCASTSKSHLLAATPRVPLSPVVHDSNISLSPDMSTSAWLPSPSPELRRKSRPGHNWPIHPEDLWKHIPSSPQPASSPPDVGPEIGVSLQRPPTLEWACARSAKRRRTNPDAAHFEDGNPDGECDTVDRIGTCHSSFRVSEARVECYDKYPLDVVRGAILLLGLRNARGPGI